VLDGEMKTKTIGLIHLRSGYFLERTDLSGRQENKSPLHRIDCGASSVMKSIQIEEHRFGVEPEIVAKLARTAVFHQQQRDVARRAAGLPARENRAQLFRYARAAVPALVRLIPALARGPASAARAD
jgi:hypothetical protein